MGIEQKISQQLNNYPGMKRKLKRIYQRVMYALSEKRISEGNISRVSPSDDTYEYFFGYYDKTPEDITGRYVLCLKVKKTWSEVAPREPAEILLIDTKYNEVKTVAITHSWNVQQGCMVQWLGPEFNKEIIYNDFRNGDFCSIILNVFTGEERELCVPVYSVSQDGKFALTLDFARLHRLRPGYGYSNVEEYTKEEKLPNTACIWKLNLLTDEVTEVLTYADFASFEPRIDMNKAEHKVNHIMFSPNGNRFMVIHRWFSGKRKYSRLITVNIDGTDMYNLLDDDMVSHCYWKNDNTIIAFANKQDIGIGYYLVQDKARDFSHLWSNISSDGHPSYSPNGEWIVTDTYPDKSRMASIRVMDEEKSSIIARVYAPFKYDNETRCDLHPRWSRDGKKIYFDSVFEGRRGLYSVSVNSILD